MEWVAILAILLLICWLYVKKKDESRLQAKQSLTEPPTSPQRPVREVDITEIFIDTETTGVNAKNDEILQLAITNRKGQEVWNKYYKPLQLAFWPEAEAINGISPSDVAECDNIIQDLMPIQSILDDAQRIYIYNANFDKKFLEAAGLQLDENKLHCTMKDFSQLYKAATGDGKWKKLELAADFTDYQGQGRAHDALEDCRMAAHVQSWCDTERQTQCGFIQKHSITCNVSENFCKFEKPMSGVGTSKSLESPVLEFGEVKKGSKAKPPILLKAGERTYFEFSGRWAHYKVVAAQIEKDNHLKTAVVTPYKSQYGPAQIYNKLTLFFKEPLEASEAQKEQEAQVHTPTE